MAWSLRDLGSCFHHALVPWDSKVLISAFLQSNDLTRICVDAWGNPQWLARGWCYGFVLDTRALIDASLIFDSLRCDSSISFMYLDPFVKEKSILFEWLPCKHTTAVGQRMGPIFYPTRKRTLVNWWPHGPPSRPAQGLPTVSALWGSLESYPRREKTKRPCATSEELMIETYRTPHAFRQFKTMGEILDILQSLCRKNRDSFQPLFPAPLLR